MTVDMQFIKIKYHAGGIVKTFKCDIAFGTANPTAMTTQNPIIPSLIRPALANMNFCLWHKADIQRKNSASYKSAGSDNSLGCYHHPVKNCLLLVAL